jgi:hypothetical protein
VVFSREARFRVEVERERDGKRGCGMAYAGTTWNPPYLSRRLDYEWDKAAPTDSPLAP